MFFDQAGEVQQDAFTVRRAQARPHAGLERLVGRLHRTLDEFQRRIQGFTQGLPGGRIDHGDAVALGKHPLAVNEATVTTFEECSNLGQDFNVAHNSPFIQTMCSGANPA
ncbi:hypothetical protein D9M69_495610 [compost metagenome]